MEKNKFYIGDNIDVLKWEIDNNSIDFSYIDPPFGTNRDFDDFDDRWKNPKTFVNDFLYPRLELIRDKLKKTATIAVHCDSTAAHYIRVALDDIFGYKRFVNEIIWQTGGNTKTKKKLYKKHDNIMVYSKSAKYTFNPIYKPYDEQYFKQNNPKMCEIRKKYYSSCAIHNAQPKQIPRPNLRYDFNGHNKQWLVTKEKLQMLHDTDRLTYSKNGIPRIKRYLDEMDGIPLHDVWTDIPSIQIGEKMDYATQKPVNLIKRIVQLYSNKNDTVLDIFAGTGTTGRACKLLNRNYILIDKNEKGKKLFKSC